MSVGKTKRSRLLLDILFWMGSIGMIGSLVLVASFLDKAEHKHKFKRVNPVGLQPIKGMKASSIYPNLVRQGFSVEQDIEADTMICKLDRYTVEILGLKADVEMIRVKIDVDRSDGETFDFPVADQNLMGDIVSVYYDMADQLGNRGWLESNFRGQAERDDGVALIETRNDQYSISLIIRNSRATSVGLLEQVDK